MVEVDPEPVRARGCVIVPFTDYSGRLESGFVGAGCQRDHWHPINENGSRESGSRRVVDLGRVGGRLGRVDRRPEGKRIAAGE